MSNFLNFFVFHSIRSSFKCFSRNRFYSNCSNNCKFHKNLKKNSVRKIVFLPLFYVFYSINSRKKVKLPANVMWTRAQDEAFFRYLFTKWFRLLRQQTYKSEIKKGKKNRTKKGRKISNRIVFLRVWFDLKCLKLHMVNDMLFSLFQNEIEDSGNESILCSISECKMNRNETNSKIALS